ncbi:hypothetical protein EOD42_22175 [Rhodovarius crocodyli]|uniref:Uncharacterized protein n=1 Tax=Rhodovarius crocodyli TaxID=1979269 RepID=A0A437M1G7_9PROT|nr:hypothetical protein [Rhodovarius crocodyli]RVT91364.1 hypothetical protein EOD42_22175 [Rhodovarius crocodyli]
MIGRHRKAYEVRASSADEPDCVYAPTAAKAKAQLVSRMEDCGWSGNLWAELSARRLPERDVWLSHPHPVLERLTDDEKHAIAHAYGVTSRNPGYRDHFATHASDMTLLRLAYEELIFTPPAASRMNPSFLDGTPDMVFFYLTDLGKAVAASMVETYPR